jgi:hypothetical protein
VIPSAIQIDQHIALRFVQADPAHKAAAGCFRACERL